jgi:hypothetical protein
MGEEYNIDWKGLETRGSGLGAMGMATLLKLPDLKWIPFILYEDS